MFVADGRTDRRTDRRLCHSKDEHCLARQWSSNTVYWIIFMMIRHLIIKILTRHRCIFVRLTNKLNKYNLRNKCLLVEQIARCVRTLIRVWTVERVTTTVTSVPASIDVTVHSRTSENAVNYRVSNVLWCDLWRSGLPNWIVLPFDIDAQLVSFPILMQLYRKIYVKTEHFTLGAGLWHNKDCKYINCCVAVLAHFY